MKTAAIIQARMTSTRLPGKVIKPVLGRPLLSYMIERLKQCTTFDDIIIATTTNSTDDVLVELAKKENVKCYRGSELDVLGRVLNALEHFNIDLMVETTGDCPLIDTAIVDSVVNSYLEWNFDYVSNTLSPGYPRGLACQVFSTELLRKVASLTQDPVDREHVSFYIYQHPEKYRLGDVKAPPRHCDPDLRLTVDTPEDFEVIKLIIENLYPQKPHFNLDDILAFLAKNPSIRQINAGIVQKTAQYNQTNQ